MARLASARVAARADRSGWLASPASSKGWAERYFLLYSPVWMLQVRMGERQWQGTSAMARKQR